MKYTWWVVRGMVGAAVGLVIGSIGRDMAFVEIGGVLGFAFGLGFPDWEQRVLSYRYLNSADVEEAHGAEVWSPAAKLVKVRF